MSLRLAKQACVICGSVLSRLPSTAVSRVRQILQPRIILRLQRRTVEQFAGDFPQQFGVEHSSRLRQRPQRGAAATQFSLHFLQLAGLLQAPQRRDDRVEHEQQHQPAVLVEKQLPIGSLVPFAADRPQTNKQRRNLRQILQPGQFPLRNRLPLLRRHPWPPCHPGSYLSYQDPWRKFRAEQDWDKPPVAPCAASQTDHLRGCLDDLGVQRGDRRDDAAVC